MGLRFDMTVIPVGAEAKFERTKAHLNETMEMAGQNGATQLADASASRRVPGSTGMPVDM